MIGKRIIQIVTLTVSGFALYAGVGAVPIAILAMIKANPEKYEWETWQTTLIQNINYFGMTLLALPFYSLMSVFNFRMITFVGQFGIGICYISIPLFAQLGWWVVCLIRAIEGCFLATLFPVVMIMLSRWSPFQERTRLNILVNSSIPFGTMMGAIISGFLAEKFGWTSIFYSIGVVILIWSFVASSILIDSPSNHLTMTDKEKSLFTSELSNEKRADELLKPPLMKIATSPTVMVLTIALIASEWNRMAINTQLPLFLSGILKISTAKTGFLISLPLFTNWLSTFVFGWIADIAIDRGIGVVTIRRIFNSIGFWGQALSLILLCNATEFSTVIFLIILGSILSAAWYSGFLVNSYDISPNFIGANLSLQLFLSTPYFALAPILWGSIVTDTEDINQWHHSFIITAIVLFVTNIIFLIFAKGEQENWDYPTIDEKNGNVKK